MVALGCRVRVFCFKALAKVCGRREKNRQSATAQNAANIDSKCDSIIVKLYK